MNLFERIRLFFDRRHDDVACTPIQMTTLHHDATNPSDDVLPFATTHPSAFKPNRWLPEIWPSRVLFICSGNICRSAYAPVIFQRLLKQTDKKTQICSAGTLRISGRMAAPQMIQAASEFGDDLSTHRSTPLSIPLLSAADVIFIMSPEHERACITLEPRCRNKICYLSHWLEPPAIEIPDPMGQTYDAYQRAAKQLNDALNHWFEQAKNIT